MTMKALNHLFFKERIFEILKYPEKFAHDCLSLSEQVHMLFSFYGECMGWSDRRVEDFFLELRKKYDHDAKVRFGSKFTNIKELASVFEDAFYEKYGWDVNDTTVPFSTTNIRKLRE